VSNIIGLALRQTVMMKWRNADSRNDQITDIKNGEKGGADFRHGTCDDQMRSAGPERSEQGFSGDSLSPWTVSFALVRCVLQAPG
jgi:hypothetical protein